MDSYINHSLTLLWVTELWRIMISICFLVVQYVNMLQSLCLSSYQHIYNIHAHSRSGMKWMLPRCNNRENWKYQINQYSSDQEAYMIFLVFRLKDLQIEVYAPILNQPCIFYIEQNKSMLNKKIAHHRSSNGQRM